MAANECNLKSYDSRCNVSTRLSSIFIRGDQNLLCDSLFTLTNERLFLLMSVKRCQVKDRYHHGAPVRNPAQPLSAYPSLLIRQTNLKRRGIRGNFLVFIWFKFKTENLIVMISPAAVSFLMTLWILTLSESQNRASTRLRVATSCAPAFLSVATSAAVTKQFAQVPRD